MSDAVNKSLVESMEHFRICHARWMKERHRRVEDIDYPETWYRQQCMFCKFFIPLSGVFMDDYGACSNPDAPFDKRVMFEHDGCEAFAEAEVWWNKSP